jgi:hypothetical protein
MNSDDKSALLFHLLNYQVFFLYQRSFLRAVILG